MITTLTMAMIYFLPSLIACIRSHKSVASIIIVNTFLGWTFLGWIACFAWCFSSNVNE